jgi:hypothetical protein
VADRLTVRELARAASVSPKRLRAWARKQGWERSGRWAFTDEQAAVAVAHFEAEEQWRAVQPEPVPCAAPGCDRLGRGEHGLCKMHYQRRARTGSVERSSGGDWQAAKTHCPAGHEYTPENTYSFPSDGEGRRRRCRACRVARSTAMKRRRARA